MNYVVVSGKEVRVGDRIFNKYGYCAGAKWATVREIARLGSNLLFSTGAYCTAKHPDEAVAVQRG